MQEAISPPMCRTFPAALPPLAGTVAEAEQAIREAIEFHLDGMREDAAPIPPPSSHVDYVEVAA
jgi:predicted RNase H-like HicB family nuclease